MSPEALEAFYTSDIEPLVLAHEGRRVILAKRVKLAVWSIFIFAIVLIVLVLLMFSEQGVGPKFALGIGVAALFVILITRALITDGFESMMKDVVIGKLCEALGWEYKQKGFESLPLEDFYRLKLLPDVDESQKFEDKISGQVDGNEFILHELRLDNGGSNGNWMFEGQILKVACSKAFLGETIVLRKKFDAPRKIDGTLKKVGLVSKKFQAAFNVYSTDQVEARFLLTPDFIQHLIDFEKSIDGRNLRFGFVDRHLLITIETEDRYQSASYNNPVDRMEGVRKNINELKAIEEIIRYLNMK